MSTKDQEKGSGMADAKGVPPSAKAAEGAPLPTPAPAPADKAPFAQHKRRWGGQEYPSPDFVRVTFLMDGGLAGEHWRQGSSADVPKAVFEHNLLPAKIAKLWAKPKPAAIVKRPATDVGLFQRHA